MLIKSGRESMSVSMVHNPVRMIVNNIPEDQHIIANMIYGACKCEGITVVNALLASDYVSARFGLNIHWSDCQCALMDLWGDKLVELQEHPEADFIGVVNRHTRFEIR